MIARVVISSPLPQLDRLFDYAVPAELEGQVAPGVRVKVNFGRSKALLEAFVIETATSSEFTGDLSAIVELVSAAPVLDEAIYKLARAVADRQASTVSDVLRLAIPDRSVAVENKWLAVSSVATNLSRVVQPKLETELVQPVADQNGPNWAKHIAAESIAIANQGESVIVIAPDFRDQVALIDAIQARQSELQVINYSSNLPKSKRYEAFLSCLSNEVSVVVGSRAAIYAPVRNLGRILIWDDGDESHQEPTSPFSHTREVALIRQSLQKCDLKILGHSRSAEVARLLSLKFLSDVSQNFPLPKIAHSESDIRVDSMAWRAIREGLSKGPVLVQVASRGTASSLFCAGCEKRAECRNCNGPLWLDERNHTKCRWCNAVNIDFRCSNCAGQKLKHGSAGTTRTIAEFGRAFPGVQVFEATADHKASGLKAGKYLVVATPGAEPSVAGGYESVVILDANRALNRDNLRATEDAVRSWSNAIALGNQNARNVLVGVTGQLADKFSLWAQAEIAEAEYASRKELGFPPAIRLASVGANKELIQVVLKDLDGLPGLEILGPMPINRNGIDTEWRVLIKYQYAQGLKVAETLKALSLRLSAGQQRVSARTGRAMRPIRIKMDDVEVI